MSGEEDLPQRAIVLDTNAFPLGPRAYRKPLLSLPTLVSLAKDSEAEAVEIWIPEVVVWELAEHAADYFAQQHVAWSAAARRLGPDAGGLGIPAPPLLAAQEIYDQTEHAIRSVNNVRVIACGLQSALEGLRDQVLQTGSATSINGIKTGAADSAWVRDVLAEAGTTTEFHLVTADTDPITAFGFLGVDPPRTHRSVRDLRSAVFRYDDSQVASAVVEVLRFLNDEDNWDPRIQLPEPELDVRMSAEVPEDLVQLEVFPVLPISVLGIMDVEITKMRGTISARVALSSTFEIAGWTVNSEGGMEQVFDTTYAGGVLAADLVFDRYDDGEISGAHADGVVVAHGRLDRFSTPEDAWEEVLQSLADLVPGVAVVDDSDWVGGRRIDVAAFEAVDVDLDDARGGWELHIRDLLSVTECVVACRHDDAAFVGGHREGQYMEPAYVVTASSSLGPVTHPTWAANVFLLEILERREPRTDPEPEEPGPAASSGMAKA